MKVIVGIGTINVDLIAYMENFPRIGETIRSFEFCVSPGGKVSNAVVTTARLSHQKDIAYMIGRFSKDFWGETAQSHFKKRSVNIDWCSYDETKTGTPLIYVNQKKENLIVTTPGASENLSCQDIQRAKKITKQAKVCILETGIPYDVAEYAAAIARENNAVSVFIPAPAKGASLEFLKNFNFVLPNETEASEISGKCIENIEDAINAAETMWKGGIENIVITCADKGALLYNQDGPKFFPSYKVSPVIDPAGAGDAFAGAFAYGLWKGLSLNTCMKLANVVGALTVKKYGTGISIPSRQEVIDFIKENNIDINLGNI